ncbi:unnamed protein product [Lasius platythorax]|uniref:Uncharacterized protein n=1 Tax=Lasius platythorax TaxID=488582 RepID=A0AAV2NVT6_9HYME
MKINPFRRRCPRNKRDRNSGNSALRSREADGMLTRRNPNATRLDDDGVEHTDRSLDLCARKFVDRATESSISSASNGSPVCQHCHFIVGLQYKFLGSVDPLYSTEWSEAGIYCVPRIISRENTLRSGNTIANNKNANTTD